ncbi:MAG: hypothetical protein LKF41_02565 [Bifidobacterium sp.]|nr:hypothetical protein [Bifidobacterium sp.]MCH4174727.1 hypothetical protein [Bifidobacterium sp.]
MSQGNNNHEQDSGSDDDFRLSDEEINAAMAGFEQELQAQEDSDKQEPNLPADAEHVDNRQASSGIQSSTESGHDNSSPDADSLEGSDFDDELEGLLGNKAKIATLITRLSSAELLAAFCHLAGIAASCVDTPEGAFAVLRDLTGNEPEEAAADLTSVISGLSAVLAVNRADKLEAKLWMNGTEGETFSPPVLFASTSSCVEDLLIGASNLSMVQVDGYSVNDTDDLDDESAMEIINRHTRPGFTDHAAGSEGK